MNKRTAVQSNARTFAMGAVVAKAMIDDWQGEKDDTYYGLVEIERMSSSVLEMVKSGKRRTGRMPKRVDTKVVEETAKKMANGDLEYQCKPEFFGAPILKGGLELRNHEDLEDFLNACIMELGAVFCNFVEVRDE